MWLACDIKQVFSWEVSKRGISARLTSLAIILDASRGSQVMQDSSSVWVNVEAELDLLLSIY